MCPAPAPQQHTHKRPQPQQHTQSIARYVYIGSVCINSRPFVIEGTHSLRASNLSAPCHRQPSTRRLVDAATVSNARRTTPQSLASSTTHARVHREKCPAVGIAPHCPDGYPDTQRLDVEQPRVCARAVAARFRHSQRLRRGAEGRARARGVGVGSGIGLAISRGRGGGWACLRVQ